LTRCSLVRCNTLQNFHRDATAAKSVVVYVTLEQKVEELRLFQAAAENNINMSEVASGKLGDYQPIVKGLRKLYSNPLWFVGRSMDRRKFRAQMDEKNVYAALDEIEKWQENEQVQIIDSVFVDYLQKFRPVLSPTVKGILFSSVPALQSRR